MEKKEVYNSKEIKVKMGNKQKQTLLDVSIDLKMTSKQLERQSMKLEGGEKAEMKKIKDVSTV